MLRAEIRLQSLPLPLDCRMEKKQHMRWTKSGAQMLLHARYALALTANWVNYTGWSPTDSSLEQAMAV